MTAYPVLSSSLPDPLQEGQVLLAVSGSFRVRTPLVSSDNWLTNEQFVLLAEEDDSAP